MAHPVLFLLTPPSHFVKSASNIPANIKKVEYLFDILNDYDHINAFSFIFNNKLCSLGQALQSHGSNGTEYDTRTVTSGDCISTGTERAKHNPSQGEGRLFCLGSCIWTACASEVTTWHEKRWAFARPPSRIPDRCRIPDRHCQDAGYPGRTCKGFLTGCCITHAILLSPGYALCCC